MNLTYGNCEGRYFTQWRIDRLESLAFEANNRFGVEDFHLWYDDEKDFHHLSFTLEGREVNIRYYKVCNIYVDGTRLTDFPVHMHEVLRVLGKKLRGEKSHDA